MNEKFISPPAEAEKEIDTRELWEKLLELFGTDEAREKFENLCRRYYAEMVKDRARAENLHVIEISEGVRARLHNGIMETIYNLMSQTKMPPEERGGFDILANRKKVAQMIDDVFGPRAPAEKKKIERMTELGKFRKDF